MSKLIDVYLTNSDPIVSDDKLVEAMGVLKDPLYIYDKEDAKGSKDISECMPLARVDSIRGVVDKGIIGLTILVDDRMVEYFRDPNLFTLLPYCYVEAFVLPKDGIRYKSVSLVAILM